MKKEYDINFLGVPSFKDVVQKMNDYFSAMDYQTLLSLKVEYEVRTSSTLNNEGISRTAILISLFGVFASCYISTAQTFKQRASFTLTVSGLIIFVILLSYLGIWNSVHSDKNKRYLLFKQRCIEVCINSKFNKTTARDSEAHTERP